MTGNKHPWQPAIVWTLDTAFPPGQPIHRVHDDHDDASCLVAAVWEILLEPAGVEHTDERCDAVFEIVEDWLAAHRGGAS